MKNRHSNTNSQPENSSNKDNDKHSRFRISEPLFAKHSIIQFWNDHYISDYPNSDEFLRENLLFISITFNPHRVCACDPRGFPYRSRIPVMQATGLLYHRIMKHMIGKNLGRKRFWQPPMFTWIDFENSRYVPKIYLPMARNPHIHALAICHPGQAQLLKYYLECKPFRRDHVPEIDTVKARFYDSSQSSLYTLADYCSKGYSKLALGVNDNRKLEMRQVFPK